MYCPTWTQKFSFTFSGVKNISSTIDPASWSAIFTACSRLSRSHKERSFSTEPECQARNRLRGSGISRPHCIWRAGTRSIWHQVQSKFKSIKFQTFQTMFNNYLQVMGVTKASAENAFACKQGRRKEQYGINFASRHGDDKVRLHGLCFGSPAPSWDQARQWWGSRSFCVHVGCAWLYVGHQGWVQHVLASPGSRWNVGKFCVTFIR